MAEHACKFCGCTDIRACPGGCSWFKPGYCSMCAETHMNRLADVVGAWVLSRLAMNPRDQQVTATLSGFEVTIDILRDSSLQIFDHLGVQIVYRDPEGIAVASHYDAPDLMPLFAQQARAA